MKKEHAFSLKILRYLFANYDGIIIGCYNSPVQMFGILALRLLRKPFCLSTDGALFISGQGFKSRQYTIEHMVKNIVMLYMLDVDKIY